MLQLQDAATTIKWMPASGDGQVHEKESSRNANHVMQHVLRSCR